MMESKGGNLTVENSKEHDISNKTTVIRISNENYECLRKVAFHERTTIRKIADEILETKLKDKYDGYIG